MEPLGGRQIHERRCKRDYPESEVEGKHTFGPPLTRAKRSPRPRTSYDLESQRSFPMNNRGCQNQDDYALRMCTPGQLTTDQSVEANSLVSSSQPVQSGEPFSDAKPRQWRRVDEHRRTVFQQIRAVVLNKRISYPKKIIELEKSLGTLIDEQHKANDKEFEILRVEYRSLREENSVLKKENEVLKEVNVKSELEIESLDFDGRSLREENSVLKKDNEVLKKNNEEVNLRYMLASQLSVESLEAAIGTGMKALKDRFDRLIFWGKSQNAVEEPVQTIQNPVLKDLELRPRSKHPHQIKQIDSDSPVQTVTLQNSGKQANDYKHNATCGLYTNGEAKPTRLCIDLSITRAAVTAFQSLLFECVDTTPWSESELLDFHQRDVFFARPNHSTHYLRSAVTTVFFEGFENESFNTMCGVSRFLDPDHRREIFYNYYLREQEHESEDDIEDPQFEEFCEMKVYSLLRKILPDCNGERAEISFLEKLGGPELSSTFRSAAKAVWLLHKLAFSFEPPATIFRVEEGADFDPTYMESKIVQLDDDERLVSKVGFMIDPGLRLPGVPIMPCEVYLAGRATTIRD